MQAELMPISSSFGPKEEGDIFMEDQATTINRKLDTLLERFNQLAGSMPLREQQILDLKGDVESIRVEAREIKTKYDRLQGAVDFARWAIPPISAALGVGGGWLSRVLEIGGG